MQQTNVQHALELATKDALRNTHGVVVNGIKMHPQYDRVISVDVYDEYQSTILRVVQVMGDFKLYLVDSYKAPAGKLTLAFYSEDLI